MPSSGLMIRKNFMIAISYCRHCVGLVCHWLRQCVLRFVAIEYQHDAPASESRFGRATWYSGFTRWRVVLVSRLNTEATKLLVTEAVQLQNSTVSQSLTTSATA